MKKRTQEKQKKHKKQGRREFIVVSSVSFLVTVLALFVTVTNPRMFSHGVLGTSTAGESRYRYDVRRTGVSLSADITTTPKLAWQYFCRSADSTIQVPPAVTTDTVYYMCDGGGDSSSAPGQGIFAFDINTGVQKWRNPLLVLYRNKTVCTQTYPNDQSIYNLTPGRMEVAGGVLYVTVCGRIVAINTVDGSLKWEWVPPRPYGPNTFSASVVGNDRIFVSAAKGTSPITSYVAALGLTDGSLIWKEEYVGPYTQNIALALDLSTLILGGGGTISGFPETKAMVQVINGGGDKAIPRWPKPFTITPPPNYAMYAPTSLKSDAIYIGGSDGKVYALKKDTGAFVWPTPYYYQAAGQVSTRLTVGKNQVTFADDRGNLYSIGNDPTLPAQYGKLRWRVSYGAFRQGRYAPSASMTSGGIIYIGNNAGEIKAFKVADGRLLWTVSGTADICTGSATPIPCNDVSEVHVAEGRIFASNDRGHLRVYKAN